MKKIILSIIFLVMPLLALSQGNNVRNFELEVGLGTQFFSKTIAKGFPPTDKANCGLNLVIEPRFNISGTPFDVGSQFSIGFFDRQWMDVGAISYSMLSQTFFFDYNFRKWKNIHLFGGVGLGMSFINLSGFDLQARDRSGIAEPRIGAEFFNHLRLTLNYRIMKREYSYFGITIGCAFWGGYNRRNHVIKPYR